MSKEAIVTPERIGRYEVREKLGEGAMSVVYKAFDADIGRELAIKLLKSDLASDATYRSRFIAEAKAAGKLNHPNIVTIFDTGECESGPYIVMELLDGLTLEDEVKVQGFPSIDDALDIGIHLADALNYSHEHRVVHRDVKPSNVIRVGGQHHVKITDFGIAHIENSESMRLTMVGTIVGTPRFMSPEQARGEQNIDGRSDLFSVGVLLYYLLTGRHPFTGETVMSLCHKIVNVPATPIVEVAPQVPAGLRRIVERLLNKDVGKRFQSGKELELALLGVRAEMEEQKRRTSENRLLPMRHTWAVILTLLVSLATAAGSYWVHRTQVETMRGMVEDFGTSLVDFVANQNGEWLLRESWPEVEVFVKTAAEGRELSHLRIIDAEGIVRGSTSVAEIGSTLGQESTSPGGRTLGTVSVSELESGGEAIIEFDSPVLYAGRAVGRVSLGLSARPIRRAALVTLSVMVGLSIAIVLFVLLGAYLLSARLSRPLAALCDGIVRLNMGDFSREVPVQPDGQFAELIGEFNRMMDRVEPKRSGLNGLQDIRDASGSGLLAVGPRGEAQAGGDLEGTLAASSSTCLMPVSRDDKDDS